MMSQQIGDLISREDTLTAFADYVGSGMSMNDFDALWDIVARMPSVSSVNLQEIRQEIETEYNKYRNMSDKWGERANGIGTALEIIDKHIKEVEDIQKLPSVNPQEPKTGHWILWNTDSYDYTYKCDKCGSIRNNDTNYCPNCGARMVEPQESEGE